MGDETPNYQRVVFGFMSDDDDCSDNDGGFIEKLKDCIGSDDSGVEERSHD